jgi:hypothetical protein
MSSTQTTTPGAEFRGVTLPPNAPLIGCVVKTRCVAAEGAIVNEALAVLGKVGDVLAAVNV